MTEEQRADGWYWVEYSSEWQPYLLEDGFWWTAGVVEVEDDEWFHESHKVGPRIELPEGLD